MSTALADLLQHLERVAEIPEQEVAELLLQVAGLLTALSVRAFPAHGSVPAKAPVTDGDRLLTADEAGQLLGLTTDQVRRRARQFPFTRKIGHKTVRYSEQGIRRWLASRR